ncbi:4273_t:CDS:1 [Dentiscutata heterogama]|uniref:4273_t:CDS:1 n=1 Tax=Dentiscutata heterogama TaxID=1316150 RepID=A0ACA9L0T1_9GLOM|nr:4273_t:CDS:1 [Dentiscutata heterogama]
MVSHLSLLIVIITAKNSPTYSSGLAKYKISQELSQTIKFKYFFFTNQSPQIFTNSDIVFIAGKYIVKNSELCFTITYSSIVDSNNPNCEFDASALSVCIPYCIYSVVVNREPKEVTDFIYFDAETIEYNSVTSKSDVKMDLTVIYPSQSSRFKYLGPSGSNIKLWSTYFISGLFKFSKTRKMIIEATDIDYLKTLSINIITSESFSLMVSDKPSIIDIIDDNIDLTVTQPKQRVKSSSSSQDINQPFDTNIHNQKTAELDEDANLQDDIEDLDEEAQPKKKRKFARGKLNEKSKKVGKK